MSGKLSILDFGKELVVTGDLDPVYVVLYKVDFDKEFLKRYLLAYWCYYDMGTAAWIVDLMDPDGSGLPGYWARMNIAAGSKDYPRGRERRHFRGLNASQSVDYLRKRGLTELFKPIWDRIGVMDAKTIMSHVQEWVGFGPWIAFKAADMIERLNGCTVHFGLDEVLYESPLAGAKMLLETTPLAYSQNRPLIDHTIGAWAMDYILTGLNPMPAPPRMERSLNVQEAETILCKWHAYMEGHYKIGEDIEAIHKALLRQSKTRTAQRLLKAGRGTLW